MSGHIMLSHDISTHTEKKNISLEYNTINVIISRRKDCRNNIAYNLENWICLKAI